MLELETAQRGQHLLHPPRLGKYYLVKTPMVERLRRNGGNGHGVARKLRGNNGVMGKPFQKGNPGKPKGAISKLTRETKEIIAGCFNRMGGEDELLRWATQDDEHQTIFYVSIWAKTLPMRMSVDGQFTVTAETALRRIDQILGSNKVIDVTPARNDPAPAAQD
jgi:endonuclease/exonuclease/phosphatase family metal-dependent hydrolase